MNIQEHSLANVNTIELSGRFDAYEAPAVAARLEKLSASVPAQIVVNLSGVNFVDTSGLAMLVKFMKHCRENQGDLRLCCLQQPVRIIFELTRLDKALGIYPDESAAVESFA